MDRWFCVFLVRLLLDKDDVGTSWQREKLSIHACWLNFDDRWIEREERTEKTELILLARAGRGIRAHRFEITMEKLTDVLPLEIA